MNKQFSVNFKPKKPICSDQQMEDLRKLLDILKVDTPKKDLDDDYYAEDEKKDINKYYVEPIVEKKPNETIIYIEEEEIEESANLEESEEHEEHEEIIME